MFSTIEHTQCHDDNGLKHVLQVIICINMRRAEMGSKVSLQCRLTSFGFPRILWELLRQILLTTCDRHAMSQILLEVIEKVSCWPLEKIKAACCAD